MRHYKKILSTTHVDAHNEQMTLSSLESMSKQANDNIIPLIVEHDPRLPPIGRIVSTQIKQLEDGEYALEGTFCICESEDEFNLLADDKREMKIDEHPINSLSIMYDRSYQNSEDITLIYELNEIVKSGSEPAFYTKKALEPISVFYIVGGFALANVAAGFFNQIGSDLWEIFKNKLKKLLSNKTAPEDEKLLSFDFTIEKDGYKVNTSIILTNPTEEDIDNFLEKGIKEVDLLPVEYFEPDMALKKIILEYSDNKLKVNFGVRKDAVPINWIDNK